MNMWTYRLKCTGKNTKMKGIVIGMKWVGYGQGMDEDRLTKSVGNGRARRRENYLYAVMNFFI